MEPTARVELATYRLQGGGSAIELHRHPRFAEARGASACEHDSNAAARAKGNMRRTAHFTHDRLGCSGRWMNHPAGSL